MPFYPGCHSHRMPSKRIPPWSHTPWCVPYWSTEPFPERDRGLCEECSYRHHIPYEEAPNAPPTPK